MNTIKTLFDEITYNIKHVEYLTSQISTPMSFVSRIPPTLKEDEHKTITEILPEKHTSYDAIKLANQALQDLHIQSPFSQKSSRRYVGLIHLRSDDTTALQIYDTLQAINLKKTELKNHIIETYQKRNERFDAIHQTCPAVMTTHLYRNVHVFLNEEIKSVRFCWQRKDSLHQPDKKELLHKIHEELSRTKTGEEVPLTQLIQKIISAPPEYLRIRRQVKVQPSANIISSTGLKTVTAPMPIFIFQNEPIIAEPIKNFSALNERKKRSDKRKSSILGTFAGHQIEQVTV